MKKTKRVNSKDSSPIVPQMGKLKTELHIFERELTEKQKEFIDISMNKDTKMIFISGPAGSAKTYTSVLAALRLLQSKKTSNVMYIRSAVECVDSKIGYLPGTESDKLQPYLQPLIDKLSELLPKNEIVELQKNSHIGSVALSFLRGLSWNCTTIIADECQNMTEKELITLITRTGEFSRIFLCADPAQTDLSPGKSGGFVKLMNIFNNENSRANGIFVIELTEDDIVRSAFCKFIVTQLKLLQSN